MKSCTIQGGGGLKKVFAGGGGGFFLAGGTLVEMSSDEVSKAEVGVAVATFSAPSTSMALADGGAFAGGGGLPS